MRTSEARVTARIRRTEDGETLHEYVHDGVAYGSLNALEAALGGA
jgi:hypothetical protein